MLAPLPIDDVLPAVVAAVTARGRCVLVAPPGAGKTTRVPGALLDSVDGEIVVLQPRRLAARLAAARVASELGVELGREVGYEVRFDRKVSSATRIRFVTEGVLTRRLLGDPTLKGVGCVIIDEFHERHLDGDLALALVARMDRKLLVMSATLDAEPVAAFLGDVPIVRSEGRTFPITIEHAAHVDDRHLGKQVASAVRELARTGLDGDVLVFLPGAGEIRRCAEDLADAAATFDLAVLPLHGELSANEQDAAVRPNPRRKVILATNVAETSVTIDGVVAVVDSGLARIARHSPWSGLPSLQVEPVSRASCAQRAGRAGRTRPGRVIRLYTKHDHDTRRAFEVPEVARTDLAGAALELHGAGLSIASLGWFEPPPATAASVAEELLGRLGATANGTITALGRELLRFPVHPRLGRLLVEAERHGVASEAAAIAALLGAREIRPDRKRPAELASPSDLIDEMDVFYGNRRAHHQVDRAAQQLERLVKKGRPPSDDAEADRMLMLCVLTAYPDRVGKRRAPRAPEIVFAGGGSGTLAPSSSVIDAELMVAVDVADLGRGKVSIRRASAIEPSWLLDLYLDRIEERDERIWNAEKKRVERVAQMTYDGLAIDETREPAPRDAATAQVLAREALAAGIDRFVDRDALNLWRARVALAARLSPAITPPTDDNLATIVAAACEGIASFAELSKLGLLAMLDAQLGPHRALVDRLAPTHLQLGRRRTPIHYELDKEPWVASRMQDFFGLARAPSIGEGKVPLVLHLLAPNQRAVQVTRDLPGFWVRHYPGLRNQLMRRYPRHVWPEDPLTLVNED